MRTLRISIIGEFLVIIVLFLLLASSEGRVRALKEANTNMVRALTMCQTDLTTCRTTNLGGQNGGD